MLYVTGMLLQYDRKSNYPNNWNVCWSTWNSCSCSALPCSQTLYANHCMCYKLTKSILETNNKG